jgi:quercetin dioxygenase-like cupin family protein
MQGSSEGRLVAMAGMELRFLVDETEGSGDLVIFEWTIAPEARVPVPHYHRAVDEVVYGLAGTLTSTVNGRSVEIRSGDSLFIPRGSVHHHANKHGDTARALIVLNPGSIGRRYFEEIAEAVNAPGKPDPLRLKAIMERHGLVPV